MSSDLQRLQQKLRQQLGIIECIRSNYKILSKETGYHLPYNLDGNLDRHKEILKDRYEKDKARILEGRKKWNS